MDFVLEMVDFVLEMLEFVLIDLDFIGEQLWRGHYELITEGYVDQYQLRPIYTPQNPPISHRFWANQAPVCTTTFWVYFVTHASSPFTQVLLILQPDHRRNNPLLPAQVNERPPRCETLIRITQAITTII